MSSSEIAKLEARWRENRQTRLFTPVAEGYRKLKEYDRCLEVVQAGLEDHPDHAPAYIVLGRCQMDLGHMDAATEAFERVLALDEENVIALRHLAMLAEERGDVEGAIARLRTILVVDPGNRDAEAHMQELVSAPPPEMAESVLDSATVVEEDAVDESGAGDFERSIERSGAVDVSAVELIEPDESIQLQDHLQPPANVEPIDDFMAEEPPAISSATAGAEEMEGLVGHDLAAQGEGVAPLEEITRSPGGMAPVDLSEPGDDPADIGEIEQAAELELHASANNEFQVSSASDELGAGVNEEPERDALVSADEMFEDDDPAELFAPDADAAAEEQMDTVATAFGADSFVGVSDDRSESEHAAASVDAEPVAVNQHDFARVGDAPLASPPPIDDDASLYAPPEPELIVTQSMAEVYLRQGLRTEALAVYRLLYKQNPDDLRLREKVDELETASADEGDRRAPELARSADVLAPTPEDSVRALFSSLLSARLGADESPAGAPEESRGEGGTPTHPADDHLSLSAVFGEESSPVPPASAAHAQQRDEEGVSFDDFFGGEPASPGQRSRSPRRDDDDLDQFQSWLQNLKR